jgi:PAS domain S-box-containing protein
LEELLAKPPGDLPPDSQALAAVAHRNGLRLLRLVNSLLDFSRIEAGRVQASYEPTDLARLTAELASSFRSACERAGLQFDVACPALPEPVYVDRDMWEKIVLNLLSNAFKFTFKGGIRVSLAAVPGGAELRVADTGVGIPAADLPRVFERFHRIDGQMSRSYEGSGIGLALVQELVRLHDGQIAVDSDAECGTTFSVKLPFGTSGLPQERIGGPRALSPTPTRSAAYVEEAFRWLPEGQAQDVLPRRGEEVEANVSVTPGPRILLADDNADMRDYLARLLSTRGWEVEAVADGAAALEATRQRRPDLVLADVMMPGLSGLELAAALRREPHLAELPIILLAARAGEKARIEGLETGADDYLVKPFAARELVARVKTHLALSRLRHDAAERVRRSEAQLQAAIELVGLCPYTWDPVTGALEWGDRLRAMWGLPPGAYVDSEVFVSGIHPEDRARVMAAIAACTDPAGNGVYHLDYRVIGMGDGVERWVSTHGQTVFKAGRPVSFIGAALDITKRKRAEEQLRASEARFRQFAEHSADVLWILNAQTKRLEYLSPAFQRIWGEPPGTLLLDRIWWAETVHPEDRTTAINALERALRGEVVTLDYRIIRADGALRWIRDTLFPIFDDREQLQWAAGIAKDITKQSGIQVYVVDAEDESRYHLTLLLQRAGYQVKTFNSARAFLEVVGVLVPGCVVLNLRAPGAGGLTVSRELKARGLSLPVIIVGGEHGDVRGAVQAMRAGTSDWLEEPWEEEVLLAAIAAAVTHIQEVAKAGQTAELARTRIAVMPVREREVLAGLMAGETNKTIARRLGISPRTVEIHRAHVMEQLGVRSLSEAVLLAAAAGLAVEPRPGSSSDAG